MSIAPAASSTDRVQTDLAKLREVVGEVVGRQFFGTMLAQMRSSKLNTGVMDGGRGEQVFAQQLHGTWATQAGQSVTEAGLGERLLKQLSHQQQLISSTQGEREEGLQ